VSLFVCSFVVEQRRRIGESLNFYHKNAARVGSFVFSDSTGWGLRGWLA